MSLSLRVDAGYSICNPYDCSIANVEEQVVPEDGTEGVD
jgi:hypothetical protein